MASLDFRLTKINETRNHLSDEVKQWFNEWKALKCMQSFELLHFLVFVSSISGCVSISAFTSLFGVCYVSISAFDSLVGIPIGLVGSAVGLKMCAITAGIKKYKSIIKKKRKKYDKIVLLEKIN